jgi:cytosine/adenosine deaminase-related metal-dependent hydrolase
MILRARVVLPLTRPPIDDGAVSLSRGKIQAVGRWRDLRPAASRRVVDLGEVILMPGLVNAHCHLDYTHMAGQIPPPKSFTEWLKVIVSTKAGWTLADYKASWQDGAGMLLRTGTTTVADIEAVPDLLPAMWQTTPLRVISFLELIGITHRRSPLALLKEALDKASQLKHRRCRIGLSPHAPYSTLPELLTRCAAVGQKRGWLLSTHAAESSVEYEMFAGARGDMYEWLKRSGRDMADCGRGSPVQHLETHGLLGRNLIAAHVNFLPSGDAALLAKRRASVAHCPRSHSYFRHSAFSVPRLARAGVNVCLGTDSLASVYRRRGEIIALDMFAEMRALAARDPALSPRKILQMATVNGAYALALEGQIGELRAGALPDLIALPSTASAGHVYEAVLHHKGAVSASMIGGSWALPPSGL